MLSLEITVTYLEGSQAAEANRLFSIFAKRVVRSLQPLFELIEGLEVVGREYVPLNNGEVNLNPIEPASVDRGCARGPRWALPSAGGRPPFGRDGRNSCP